MTTTSDERVTDDRQEMEEGWSVEAADDALGEAHWQIGEAVGFLQDHPNTAWSAEVQDRLIRLSAYVGALRLEIEMGEALDR